MTHSGAPLKSSFWSLSPYKGIRESKWQPKRTQLIIKCGQCWENMTSRAEHCIWRYMNSSVKHCDMLDKQGPDSCLQPDGSDGICDEIRRLWKLLSACSRINNNSSHAQGTKGEKTQQTIEWLCLIICTSQSLSHCVQLVQEMTPNCHSDGTIFTINKHS